MNVLCAVDGSAHSRWALETVQGLVPLSRSSLTLVHVVTEVTDRPAAGLQALELPEDRGEAVLAQVSRETVSRRWAEVRPQALRGRPADAIIRTAAREACDLIAVGSRGLTDVRSFLLGSVARKTVMYSPCPVLVVKRPAPAIARVVLGTDGGPEARSVADLLGRLTLAPGAEVTVVAVVPPVPGCGPDEPGPARADCAGLQEALHRVAQEVAGRAAAALERQGLSAATLVTQGPVAHRLITLADSLSSDLLAVGSRGARGSARYLLGSVSDSVVMYAPCSVLVFRPGERATAES